jgi:hypothetical protein
MAICNRMRALLRAVLSRTALASAVVLLFTSDALCQTSSVSSTSLRPFVVSWTPVIGRNGAVGGIAIDGDGVVSRTTLDDTTALSDAWLKASKPTVAALNQPSRLRKVSLTRLETALTRYLDKRDALPDEMMFLEVRGVFRTVRLLIYVGAEGWEQRPSRPFVGLGVAAVAHPRCGFRLILRFQSDNFTIFLLILSADRRWPY